MGTLAFFPWLAIEDRLTTSLFDLLPYRRALANEDVGVAAQPTCDAILEPYRSGPTIPVRRATILQLAGRKATDQLDDDMINRVIVWGDLVAFSGLAAVTFFDPSGYANRDAFRLIVQNFDDPTQGLLVTSRRRDGSLRSFVSRSAALFTRPLHVQTSQRSSIDLPLLRALLARSEQDDWGRFQEAIQQFNAASTDSPDVLQETETVNLVGAFERLFDLSHGKEDELAAQFTAVFEPQETRLPEQSQRVAGSAHPKKFARRGSMREVWIRDFFQLRGQHAHGKIESPLASLWALREHLLLAGFVFPLVVKCLLAADKHYEMTAADVAHLDAFEALLEPDHFAVEPHPWSEIIGEVRMRRWVAEFVAKQQPEE